MAMDLAELATVAQHLPDAVLVVDHSGHLMWGNRAAEQLFDARSDDMIGIDVFTFLHPDDAQFAALSFTSVQGKDIGTPIEIRVKTSHGWKLVELIGTTLLRDPRLEGLILSLRDVTERRLLGGRLQ